MRGIGPVALVHIDCDIYSSITFCYEAIKEYLVNGAYIVFDDCLYSHCLGAFEAVEEALIKKDGLNAEQNSPQLVSGILLIIMVRLSQLLCCFSR
jgi:hypothetical protein